MPGEQLESFTRQLAGQVAEASHVPAGMGQARDQAALVRIGERSFRRHGESGRAPNRQNCQNPAAATRFD
jgi:hypothetical protein